MGYCRSAAEEVRYRLELFFEIYRGIVDDLKAGARDPIFSTPMNLTYRVLEESTRLEPFGNKTKAEYVRDEAALLLTTDPVLANDASVRQPFDDLASAAARIAAAANRAARIALARSDIPGPLVRAQRAIDQGDYFRGALRRLIYQVCDAPVYETTADALEQTTRALVFGFLAAGFSPSRIGSLGRDVASDIVEVHGYAFSNLPSRIDQRPFFIGLRFEREKFNEALRVEVAAQGTRERLLALQTWYDEALRRYVVLFRVTGVKGHREFRVNGVHFYPALPQGAKYIYCCDGDNDPELFLEADRFNAAVYIDAHDQDAAWRQGLEKVNGALDIVRYAFSPEAPLGIDPTKMAVADEFGHQRGGHYSIDRGNFNRWLDFDRLFNNAMTYLRDCDARLQAITDSRQTAQMQAALHSVRRSGEAILPEDRLLAAWVAIEAILGDETGNLVSGGKLGTTEERVRIVMRAIAMNDLRFSLAVDMHNMLRKVVSTQQFNRHRDYVGAPDKVLAEAGLLGGFPVATRIEKLLEGIRDVRPFVRRPGLRAKVEATLRFYDDANEAKTRLIEYGRDVDGEITAIYQIRNGYVHQAKRGTEIVEYYADRALRHAGKLIWTLMQPIATGTISGSLQAVIDRVDQVLGELDAGTTRTLLA